jgi:hypothetical protein
MVEVTAADLFSWGPGSASQQLEFFEELSRRPIVSHDDAVHAALLFSAGSSAPTYQARLSAARSRGLIDAGYSRPAREAATVGEVSRMLARSLRLPGGSTEADATAALKREGLLPEHAEAQQGLTGAQMLALLGAAEDFRLALGEDSAGPVPGAPARATARGSGEGRGAGASDVPPSPERPVLARSDEAPRERAAPEGAPRPMREPLPELPAAGRRRPGAGAAGVTTMEILATPRPAPMPAGPIAAGAGGPAPAAQDDGTVTMSVVAEPDREVGAALPATGGVPPTTAEGGAIAPAPRPGPLHPARPLRRPVRPAP